MKKGLLGVLGIAGATVLTLAAWRPSGACNDCSADSNGDCVVGVTDLLILLMNWG